MEDISTYFGRIQRSVTAIVDAESHDAGLGRGAWRIFHFIGRHPGTTQQAICSRYGINKAATARQCATLEEKGLIYRVENENDGRSKLLYLTDKAKELQNKSYTNMDLIYARFLTGLTDEEKKVLACLLDKMCMNIPCNQNELS